MKRVEAASKYAHRRGAAGAGAVLILVAGLAGCGGDSSEAAAGDAMAGRSESPAASMAGELRDACTLIRPEEITAIVGEPVTARPEAGRSNKTTCTYESPTSDMTWFGITVTWRGGRESWEIQQSGTALAIDLMSEAFGDEDVDVDSIVRPGPVGALGDAAVFSDIMPSAILKDDILIEMLVMFLPDPERHFAPLGRKALERL
ncbi:MAG: DUF3558 family protein [Longimicrobiales bacterium]